MKPCYRCGKHGRMYRVELNKEFDRTQLHVDNWAIFPKPCTLGGRTAKVCYSCLKILKPQKGVKTIWKAKLEGARK